MKKLLFLFLLIINFSFSQTIGIQKHDTGSLDNGYVLFSPIGSTTTFLIDKCGKQIHSWTSAYNPGLSCYFLADGSLIRAGKIGNDIFTVGGTGGIIEKFDWDGNVMWSYTVSDATKCQHHDFKVLPNGNILIIAWELKSKTEAIDAGINVSVDSDTIWSEQILEVQPSGTNGGTIVWEWHLWDHLVQDYDDTKLNHGVVASNPKLINLNYILNKERVHMNSVDYNPILDQIVMSAHNFNEIWVIDHSTTSAQAASHTGGKSGNGGDIIYRWGNPEAYDNGTIDDKKLFGQHNAHWIESGLPFENQIMIFNNGNGRLGGNYSTVEIINPPVNGSNYSAEIPYLPNTSSWNYNNGNPNKYYAMNISGAQQLSNGNVLLCNGPGGFFTEVTTSGEQVWKYTNPVNALGITNQGSNSTQNTVFRCTFYPSDYSGFNGHSLTPGNIIENSNVISESCNLNLANVAHNLFSEVQVYPNPTTNILSIDLSTLNETNVNVQLVNMIGQIVYEQNTSLKQLTIPVSNYSNGMYFVKINNELNQKVFKVIIEK